MACLKLVKVHVELFGKVVNHSRYITIMNEKKHECEIVKASVPKPNQKLQRTVKGPEPERLKIEGNWVKAVDVALRKPKPPGGWPK